MLEGLWSVKFRSNIGDFGAGVAIFVSNRILGGDAQYYYVGNIERDDSRVSAEITVTHYSGEPKRGDKQKGQTSKD